MCSGRGRFGCLLLVPLTTGKGKHPAVQRIFHQFIELRCINFSIQLWQQRQHLQLATTAWAATEVKLYGDQAVYYPCGGDRMCLSCGPATKKVCATIELGGGNPGGGYPDKATLYNQGTVVSTFNCIYLGPGPSGDPTQDAALIPEPLMVERSVEGVFCARQITPSTVIFSLEDDKQRLVLYQGARNEKNQSPPHCSAWGSCAPTAPQFEHWGNVYCWSRHGISMNLVAPATIPAIHIFGNGMTEQQATSSVNGPSHVSKRE